MKNLLIASAAALALSASSALAADMHMPYKAPPPPPPVATWTGCYVDAGWGYGMWNQDHYTETTALVPLEPSTTTGGRGWLGRFGGGCDYQLSGGLSSWVIGAFADYDAMDLKGTWDDPLASATAVVGDEKETGAWAAGARLGYLVTPSLLTYVNGGWTGTRFSQIHFMSNTLPSVTFPTGIEAQTYHGWFIGGGTEYALNWSWLPIHGLFWRNEYRYSSFKAKDVSEVTLATDAPIGLDDNMKKNVQTITSSLVWRFNWTH